VAFEGDISGKGTAITVDLGTSQEGVYAWTGWQEWTSADDPTWSIAIDGTGFAELSDGTDVVAERAADASKLYDPSGPYTSTTYGATTYGTTTSATAGTTSAGTITEQDFVLLGTVGAIETWNGVTDPSQYIELDTGTGDAILYDGFDSVAERLGGSTSLITGSYTATTWGEDTYNGGTTFTFTVATSSVSVPFSISSINEPKANLAGYAYVLIETDAGTNDALGITGPFFAAALPANTSTSKSIPLAYSDGAGVIEQIQTGPIIWQP